MFVLFIKLRSRDLFSLFGDLLLTNESIFSLRIKFTGRINLFFPREILVLELTSNFNLENLLSLGSTISPRFFKKIFTVILIFYWLRLAYL